VGQCGLSSAYSSVISVVYLFYLYGVIDWWPYNFACNSIRGYTWS
jgi:hypothetical protein